MADEKLSDLDISDEDPFVSHSNPKRRFVIDTTDHPDVKLVKSTYLSISRYVTQQHVLTEETFNDITNTQRVL